MDYRKKFKSLILLILIVNALSIVHIPIREFHELQSGESEDFRTKLHNRYEPLLFLLGPEKHIGHFVELNVKNDNDLMKYARIPMLRYILAPRILVKISNSNFFMSDEKTRNKEMFFRLPYWDDNKVWNSPKRPDVVIYEGIPEPVVFIYEGIPEFEILQKYPAFIKVNENLYILKKHD